MRRRLLIVTLIVFALAAAGVGSTSAYLSATETANSASVSVAPAAEVEVSPAEPPAPAAPDDPPAAPDAEQSPDVQPDEPAQPDGSAPGEPVDGNAEPTEPADPAPSAPLTVKAGEPSVIVTTGTADAATIVPSVDLADAPRIDLGVLPAGGTYQFDGLLLVASGLANDADLLAHVEGEAASMVTSAGFVDAAGASIERIAASGSASLRLVVMVPTGATPGVRSGLLTIWTTQADGGQTCAVTFTVAAPAPAAE